MSSPVDCTPGKPGNSAPKAAHCKPSMDSWTLLEGIAKEAYADPAFTTTLTSVGLRLPVCCCAAITMPIVRARVRDRDRWIVEVGGQISAVEGLHITKFSQYFSVVLFAYSLYVRIWLDVLELIGLSDDV